MPTSEAKEPMGNTPATDEEVYAFPATQQQKRFWFLDQMRPGDPASNIAIRYSLTGPLHEGTLRRAIAAVVERHEVLRTYFAAEDSLPVQIVTPSMEVELRVENLEGLGELERQAEADRQTAEEARAPFDIAKLPLVRFRLLRFGPTSHILLITLHHIISDGWSLGVLTREIAEHYDAFALGVDPRLPPLPIQYADYAVWQDTQLAEGSLDPHFEYWHEKLRSSPTYEIRPDRQRPEKPVPSGKILSTLLPADVVAAAKELGQSEGATPYITFLTVMKALLARWTREKDVVLGSPVAGRDQVDTEGLIGLFINLIVLRTDLSDNPSMRELLRRVRGTVMDALSHDVPFERLFESLNPVRESNRHPLFQISFGYQRAFMQPVHFADIQLDPIPSVSPGELFDMSFFLVERDEGVRLSCGFHPEIYGDETILQLLRSYRELLSAAVRQPDTPVDQLPLLSPHEEAQLIEAAGAGCRIVRPGIHRLFEKMVARTPSARALLFGDTVISYSELNLRANRLAAHLRDRRIGPGVIVGLCMDRSPELIVAILATLKTGAAYMPLDSAYPAERMRFMLEDSGTQLLVTTNELAARIPSGDLPVVCLDSDRAAIDRQPSANLPVESTPESVAYIMYTSGSTGTPKATLVPHRAVTRLVIDTNYARFGPEQVILQLATVSFDASTYEIWGALLNGGALAIAPPGTPSAESIGRLIRKHGVTATFITTGLFHVMVDENVEALRPLQTILTGGDVVSPTHARKLLETVPECRLVDVYGPTENTTYTTFHDVTFESLELPSLPIGKAISGTSVYILDEQQRLLPPGAIGELYAGGDGVALGYLNRPELTAERFIPDPFSGREGDLLYRTGDLVRYLPDGEIEFLGRVDHQVKVSGFRVELGEIEAALRKQADVGDAVVVVREDQHQIKRLVAYALATKESTAEPKQFAERLRSALQQSLPEYMQPAAIVPLDHWPLNANGKVDRKALPDPSFEPQTEKGAYVAPRDSVERKLATIFEEILAVERVGVTDSFFDLGGYSLMVVRLFARINSVFKRSLPITAIFDAPTIEKLAEFVRGKEANDLVVPVQTGGTKPPFFLIHSYLIYGSLLSVLGPDQPFYGIREPEKAEHQPKSLEDRVAEYVEEIVAVCPEGPVHMAGWCAAGPIALEAARQLREAGREVATVMLFDSWSPSLYRPDSAANRQAKAFRTARGKTKLRRHLEKMREYGLGGKLRYVFATVAHKIGRKRDKFYVQNWTLMRRLSMKYGFRLPDFMQNVTWMTFAALREHEAKPYAGHVTLFRASDPPVMPGDDPARGWGEVALGGVDVVMVPGDHESMFKDDHLKALGDQINLRLNAASTDAPVGTVAGGASSAA